MVALERGYHLALEERHVLDGLLVSRVPGRAAADDEAVAVQEIVVSYLGGDCATRANAP